MKKILFAFSMMFAMVACSYDDVTMPHEVPTDGTTLLNFSVQVPDMQQATRSMASQAITKLDLVVFDEQGYFVEVAHAKVSNSESWNDNTTPANSAAEQKYSVELLQSAAPRIIHFIANSPVDSYSYGSERELINALETSGSDDAYWQREELSSILGDQVVTENNETKVVATANSELAKALNQIPLVRNFAKVTFTNQTADDASKGNFTDVRIAVYNAPQRGKVAPYNTNAGMWADYKDVPSYTTLTTAKYYGYEATNLGGQTNDFANTGFGTEQYLYEYNMDGKNITAGTKYPFVIIEGKYLGKNTSYYKVDLVDADGNYYNILRNFNYNVVINSVSGDGYARPEDAAAAAASNNISASIDTRNLLNISDGVSRLYVEYTSKYITTTAPVTLKYKFVPNINNPTVTDNDDVTLSGFTSGDVIYSHTNANDTVDSDGWSIITITPKDISGTKEQAVTLSASTLSRTVTFYSVSAYLLEIDCPAEVAASVGTSMTATLTIPENLPEAIFPLEFVIVSDKLSISPDATQENMPVKTGLNADGTEGGQYFGFVKTLEYEDYVERGADGNITGYNTSIPCHFKTSIAASASTVSAYNPYFTAASDSFTNPKEYRTETLRLVSMSNANYYGADQAVTVTIEAPGSGSTPLPITLEFTGMKTTRATAEMTTTPIGNDQHTVTLYTADWSTTRTVTKVSCATKIDTGLTEITYNPSANTNTLSSGTVNVLHIPAGNIKWATSPRNNQNIRLYRVTGNESLDVIGTSSSSSVRSNNEVEINKPGLDANERLYLRYERNNSYQYSTTYLTVSEAINGVDTTFAWQDSRPNYSTMD